MDQKNNFLSPDISPLSRREGREGWWGKADEGLEFARACEAHPFGAAFGSPSSVRPDACMLSGLYESMLPWSKFKSNAVF